MFTYMIGLAHTHAVEQPTYNVIVCMYKRLFPFGLHVGCTPYHANNSVTVFNFGDVSYIYQKMWEI